MTEDGIACESADCPADAPLPRAGESLAACLGACDADPGCVAITDAWWGRTGGAEYLVHASECTITLGCDSDAPLGRYEKLCP